MRADLTDLCRQLRLAHVVEYVVLQQDEQVSGWVEQLLTAELDGRRRAKLGKLVQQAGFPHIKTFEGYVYDHISFPSESSPDMLRELEWLERKENLLLMGAVGTGKTHMAIALGIEACRQGKAVQFYRASDLVAVLQEKFAAGTVSRFREKLKKVELFILDEVGYVPFSQTGSELLFNVIADCYERQSVIVTSNLEFGQWTSIFGDTKLTSALVDRLVHHAHILSFTGESFRFKQAMERIPL
ncbi:IS21-like element helper ATPase IstB [Paenibacillus apiarius]|uniref:IS21-like element helper ATPase IstB n=1 Tax=Paenibacillus apiarius TaxID=46240 RepID=UPI0019822D4C|nr:IS21-like element helper ATPase IstB [Paenibacillus apiarius]MBN3525182.1 IS21-like element helper ATPase IstB [Paenibacillus apiarius]